MHPFRRAALTAFALRSLFDFRPLDALCSLFGFEQLTRVSDGVIDVRTEVLLANQVDEASASHGFHGLLVSVAEDELHAIFLTVIVEILERIHARRVERRHAAHADDKIFRELLYRNVGNAVGHAEEH